MSPRRHFTADAAAGHAPEKFEELLARLEQIVADMENADLPLEKLLATYEEGMRLVKSCGARLADAEQKVEILSRSLPADAPKAPSEPAKAIPLSTETNPGPTDDIRLF